MTAPTHIAFAEVIYLLLLTSGGVALNLWNGIVIALASLLPDLDTGASILGRILPALSRRLERRFGHRTLTHSLPFAAALAAALFPLVFIERDFYLCLIVGYASHPVLDSCTVTGVRLLYPVSSARCVFPMDVNSPLRYRIHTGSKHERVLAAVFIIACIPALLIAHFGYQRFVRVAQGNIESAVRDYNDFSQTHLVYVECRARNLLTKEHVEGRFRVVGSLDAQTLLIRDDQGRLETLGKEYRAGLVAEHAVCLRGEAARVIVERINMAGKQLDPFEGPGEIHLFGRLQMAEELHCPETPGSFSPIFASGHEVKLSYATPEEVENRLGHPTVESGFLDVRRVLAEAHSPKPDASHSAQSVETIMLLPGDELLWLSSQGEDLEPGEVIASWEEQASLKREIEELKGSMVALRLLRKHHLEDVNARMAHLVRQVQRDSEEACRAAILLEKGFGPEAALRGAIEQFSQSRAARVIASNERQIFAMETDAKVLSLGNRLKSLESRLLLGSGKRELKAKRRCLVERIERKEKGIRIYLRAR
jgi:membrane-bound metal-dependent hydrolase YbcI (DUF457 family)